MGEPSLFNTVLIWPLINLLVAIYQFFMWLNFPYALGFAIIGLTIVIRFALYPLTASQLTMTKKMQRLNPHLSSLKEKHKGDSKRIQEETMKLYKEHGVNPLAGCLPFLIQLPIIWGLYSVLNQIVKLPDEQIVLEINKVLYTDALSLKSAWDTTFFGVPLGQSPAQLLGTFGLLVLLVPVITGILQYFLSKMTIAKMPEKTEKEEKEKKPDDFMAAFQKQSLYIFPAMIAFFSFNFPFGLSLYWNVFTLFGIIQQQRVNTLYKD